MCANQLASEVYRCWVQCLMGLREAHREDPAPEMKPCTSSNRLLHAVFLAVVAVHAIGIQTRTLETELEILVAGVHVHQEFTENCRRQKCHL